MSPPKFRAYGLTGLAETQIASDFKSNPLATLKSLLLNRFRGDSVAILHSTLRYSTIGDTISCDAPYSAIDFRGKLFLRSPPSKACLWLAIGYLYGKKWGCSSDSLRNHRKHSATGILLHLSRDSGGISVGSQSNLRLTMGPVLICPLTAVMVL